MKEEYARSIATAVRKAEHFFGKEKTDEVRRLNRKCYLDQYAYVCRDKTCGAAYFPHTQFVSDISGQKKYGDGTEKNDRPRLRFPMGEEFDLIAIPFLQISNQGTTASDW